MPGERRVGRFLIPTLLGLCGMSALPAARGADPYPGPNGPGHKNCGGGILHNGWCQAGLYCAENMGVTSQNECKACTQCHGHGSCGRGTNTEDGGGGDGPNGGYPGPCECEDGYWGFDCTNDRCSGSECAGGAWGLGLQELNLILDRVSVNIPGSWSGSEDAPVSTLDWTLKNVKCQHLGIGGIRVKPHKDTDQPEKFRYMEITVSDITVECTADWTFQYGFSGAGSAIARTQPYDHTSVHVGVKYKDDDFSRHLPLAAPESTCQTLNVQFGKFTMHGSNIGGSAVSLFDGTIKDKILEALDGSGGPDSVMCQQVGDISTDLLTSVLTELNGGFEPLLHYMNLTAPPPKNVTGQEMLLKTDCPAVAQNCPPPELVDFRSNWIVQLLQLGATKLNSPAPISCHRDWQNIQRCTGPLVVNQVVDFITSQLGGSGQIDIVDFFGLFNLNTSFSTGSSAVIGVDVQVESLKFDGLNSFVTFNVLESVGNYTFLNELVLDFLGMSADVTIKLTPNADGSGVVVSGGPPIVEHATFHAGVKNASVAVAALLAVVEDIALLPLGTVASNPTGCLMSKVFLANLTYANVTVSGLQHPMLHGFVSKGVDELFNGIADTAFMLYEEIGLKILPGVIQTSVRTAINDVLIGYINDDDNVICPSCENSTTHPCLREPIMYMDFETTYETTYVAWLLNEAIGANNINTAIGSLTQAVSGVDGMYVDDTYLVDSTTVMKDGHDTPTRKGTCFTCSRIGRIQIQINDLKLTGLDTLSDISLLHPSAPYVLHNQLTLAADTRPLNASVNVLLKVDGTELTIDDNFELTVSLHGLHFLLDILLKIDQGKFWSLRLEELTEISNYLATLAAARPDRFQLDFAEFGLHVNCRHCSSPLLREMAANLRRPVNIAQLTAKVNEFVAKMGQHFVEDPQVQANYLKMLAVYSDEVLNQTGCMDIFPVCKMWASTLQCDLNPEYMRKYCRVSCGVCTVPSSDPDTDSDNIWVHVVVVTSVLAACCVVSVCCFPSCSKKTSAFPRSNSRKSASKELQTGLLINVVEEASDSPRKKQAAAVQNGCSLFHSDTVPAWIRKAIPLCLLGNICLFISGHLSIGATVDVDIHFAGDHVRVDRFVEFSLGNSLKDMYNANAMVLFYFVGSFSGLWPYTKLLLMLYCWFAPPGCLRPATRGWLLEKLDYAGTWSLIDLYVLVMCMLGFHLDITSPTSLSFLPAEFYLIKAMVTPVWGLYAFMLGVILSLIINYLCIHYHRQERSAIESLSSPSASTQRGDPIVHLLDSPQLQKEALMAHVFEGRGLPYRFDFRGVGQKGVCAMLALSLLLTLVGGLLVSFQFKVHGLAGVFSDMGTPDSSLQRFSLVNSAAAIAAQGPARYMGNFGPVLIAVVYLSFAFLVPLAVLLLMVAQWVLPMTLRTQKRLYIAVEALTAWSALEVFMAAIIVAMLEIGLVSGFIVGNNCDGVTDWLGNLVTYGLLDSSDKTCFLIEADIQVGMWVLGLASIVTMITNRTVNKLAHAAILDRAQRQAKQSSAEAVGTAVPDQPEKTAGYVERLMHCALLGSGFIHTWDKSWDTEFRSSEGGPRIGIGTENSKTNNGGTTNDIFPAPVSSARSVRRRPPSPPRSPASPAFQRQSDEILSPSVCAMRAVTLDKEGKDGVAAAEWYSRAAAGLVEQSKLVENAAKVKCLAKANEYDTRAQVLRSVQSGNASAEV